MTRISLVEQYDNKDVIQQIYKLKDDQSKLEQRQASMEGSLDSAVTNASQALTESGQAVSEVEALSTQVAGLQTDVTDVEEQVGQAQTDADNAVASAVIETTSATAKLKVTKNNQAQAETDIPIASGTQAGMMGASTYNGLVQLGDRVSALENKQNVYYVTFPNATPSQSEITTAFTTASGRAPQTGDYCTDIGKNLTYGYNGTQWIEVTGSDVPAFTNEVGGIIKGDASTPGKVFAETDGTGSVNGWDALEQSVADNGTAIEQNTSNVSALTTRVANLESAQWKELDATNPPTDFQAGDVLMVFLKCYTVTSSVPSDWSTAPTQNDVYIGTADDEEHPVIFSIGAAETFCNTVFNTNSSTGGVTIDSVLASYGVNDWNNSALKTALFKLLFTVFNGGGRAYKSIDVTRSNLITYVTRILRLRPN